MPLKNNKPTKIDSKDIFEQERAEKNKAYLVLAKAKQQEKNKLKNHFWQKSENGKTFILRKND